MAVIMTQAGESLIARLQAEGKPLVIDEFYFAFIDGQDPTAPLSPVADLPGNIVYNTEIPQEYRAFVNPNQVVYSAMLGSDVGPFKFNWQGLYCSAHDTLVACGTFPTLEKRAYDPSTNTAGNNLTRNFILNFTGAQELTEIKVEAKVWQIDFTIRLKSIDERERLSNRDIYDRASFIEDGWLLVNDNDAYSFKSGLGYVEGIRAALYEPLHIVKPDLPCDVYLDVCMEPEGSDVLTKVNPLFVSAGQDIGDYKTDPPNNIQHYVEKIAHIDADGKITDLRTIYSLLPKNAKPGQIIIVGDKNLSCLEPGPEGTFLTVENGILSWKSKYNIGQYYWFEDDLIRPGMFPCLGGVVQNISNYPQILEYLSTEHGAKRLVTQSEYDDLHVATWHTCADGTKIGWEGVGGVNKFVWNKENDTLRLPDLAGMMPEQIGFDGLGVGDVDGDRGRNITGRIAVGWAAFASGQGAFESSGVLGKESTSYKDAPQKWLNQNRFCSSRVVPTGKTIAPKRYGSRGCVWLGLPK